MTLNQNCSNSSATLNKMEGPLGNSLLKLLKLFCAIEQDGHQS